MELNLNQLKNKNKNKKEVIVNPTQPSLTTEREYYAQMRAFNNLFKTLIRKELLPVIERMSKLTTDGIGEDLNLVIERIKQQFNLNAKAGEISKKMVNRVNNLNLERTKGTINNSIGVDLGNILKSENLTDFIEMQTIKNAELIKSVPNDAIEDIRRIVFNGLSEGLRHEEIAKQITGSNPSSVFRKMNNRIKTIARTEVAKINSQITNKRLDNLGVKRAIWDATNDSRTRPCHTARDGKVYDIKKGLYSSCDGKTLQPGQEINCRCVARPIIE